MENMIESIRMDLNISNQNKEVKNEIVKEANVD